MRAPSWVTAEDQLGGRRRHALRERGEERGVVQAGGRARHGQHGRRLGAVAAHQPRRRRDPGRARRAGRLPAAAARGVRHGPGGQAALRDGGVDGVLRHPPVRRELAADHGDRAGPVGQHRVPAGEVGGAASSGARVEVEQRTQPGVGPDHVVAAQRLAQHRADDREQEVDLGVRRHGHVGHRAVGRLVGEPDVRRCRRAGAGRRRTGCARPAPAPSARRAGRAARRGAPGGCRARGAGGRRRPGRRPTRRPR